MADRQTRRALRRPNGAESATPIRTGSERIEILRTDSNDELESGTEPDIYSGAVGDDNESPVERNDVEPNGPIGVVEVDPGSIGEFIARGGADTGNGDGRKRRTRADAGKPRNSRRRKETPQNLDTVIGMIHTMAAVMTHTPELKLDKTEIEEFTSVYTEFCAYHDVPVLTPKRMSEVALIAFAFKLYGPRFVAIRNRIKRDSKQRGFNVHEGGRQPEQRPVM